MSEAAPATITRLMRMSEVLTRTSIKSRSTVYELEAQGLFPARVHLTGKAIAFVESEVDAWIASRIAARPEATPATRPARLRHRSASTSQTTTRSSTASQDGATPPATTSTTSTATTAPPRRRGPARTRAQRQQAQGK